MVSMDHKHKINSPLFLCHHFQKEMGHGMKAYAVLFWSRERGIIIQKVTTKLKDSFFLLLINLFLFFIFFFPQINLCVYWIKHMHLNV